MSERASNPNSTTPTPVIVTRPEPDASAFAKMCEVHGYAPVLSPVMRIAFNDDAPQLDQVSCLAFTSANGARAFAAASDERALPVFAVGQTTAEAARTLGFEQVLAADGDVTSLSALIAETLMEGTRDLESEPNRLVLHVAGSNRAGDLLGSLATKNIEGRLAVLYTALPESHLSAPARALLNDAPSRRRAAVALFSPRTARLFFQQSKAAGLARHVSDLAAVCLSEAVAEALVSAVDDKNSPLNFRKIEIAPTRDTSGIFQALGRCKDQ